MMKMTFYSKLLLLVAACLAGLVVHAENRLYINDLRISSDDIGNRITVPVRASFDTPVSAWDVEFQFPEGLTPVKCTKGADSSVSYLDGGTDPLTASMELCQGQNYNHFSGFIITSYCDSEGNFAGTVKWPSGNYEEMLLLTIQVDWDFNGGDIIVNTKTTCSYDANFDTGLHEASAPWGGGVPVGDVNQDEMINISDVAALIDYIVNPDNAAYVFAEYADVTQDGVVDIRDMTSLADYILTGIYYEGYVLHECSSTSHAYLLTGFDCFFEIDGFDVISNQVGEVITVPVRAYFENYVSSWGVEFQFPEGLTPLGVVNGDGLNVAYTNDEGIPSVSRANLSFSNDFTRVGSNTRNISNYELNEYDEYESTGSAKWDIGLHELFLLKFRVEENFGGGEITIHCKTSCGYDSRPEINPFLTPGTMDMDLYEYDWPGDINGDGIINISDVIDTWYFALGITYLNGDPYIDPSHQIYADVTLDGVVDICDYEKMWDYCLMGQWFDGYPLGESEVNVVINYIIAGDLNGDGKLRINDVTLMVDQLLNSVNGGNYPVNDVNGDGAFNINDLTALVDLILGNN